MMEYEYYAFISYKRGGEDEKWAKRLQHTLERYRIPIADLLREGNIRENFPKRLKIFRDKSDLGSHMTVEEGLSANLSVSKNLIVICSCRSAESLYVDGEVKYFAEAGRSGNIAPLFIGSEQAVPPSMPEDVAPVVASDGYEETFIRLMARLLNVDYDNMRQAHLRASRREAMFRLAAVAAVLVIVTGLALWAVSAERRATQMRLESEDLVNFLTFDLARDKIGWLSSERRAMLTLRAAEYYERWEPGEAGALFAYAVNLVQQGDVAYALLWNVDGAVDFYSQALEIMSRLRDSDPENERFFIEYSGALAGLGNLFEIKGDIKRAEQYYRMNNEVTRKFADDFPNSLKGRGELANSFKHLAQMEIGRGNFREANDLYEKCGAIWDETLLGWPEETQSWLWKMKRGDYLSGAAYVNILQNNLYAALDYLADSVSLFGELCEEDPENMAARLLYADAVSDTAFVLTELELFEEAESMFLGGQELWRELAADDPQPIYFHGWARILTTGSLLRIKQKRQAEADDLLDLAEEIVERILLDWPGNEAFLATKSLIEEYRNYSAYCGDR